MTDPRKRLLRLRRLERIREIARQNAAASVSEAEATLAQLSGLSERTRRMAEEYAGRRGAQTGADLASLAHFTAALEQLSATTASDTDRARAVADARQVELGTAERRRAAVEQRVHHQTREIAKAAKTAVLGARRPVGTPFE